MAPNIFEFTDHRAFIREYYDYHKQKNPRFSYRLFAKKAGFSSSAFLPLLISGKRTIAKESIRRLAAAMGLSKREAMYFESLVWFNQAKDEASQAYYRQLLSTIRKDKSGKLIREDQFEYLSNWHYPVIREMVAIPGFREDAAWISALLGDRIPVRHVRHAIEVMLKLKLLARDKAGRLRQVDAAITTTDEVQHTAVFLIHQQMLLLAREVLVATRGIGSEFSGLTMALSRKQFGEIVAMIREFQNEIVAYFERHTDIPTTVAQLNVQFFPILKE